MLNDIYQALDPIAFWVGPFVVRWYGLAYIFGILIGGFVLMRVCKRWEIRFTFDALLTVFIAAVLGIILGARLGYVLFYGAGYYLANPAAILNFSGMSFHGGVIGMFIAMFIACRVLKMPFASLGDLVVIVAPIGLFLGRLANFINGELWGAPTSLPWGVEFESGGGISRHPSQLYEALLEGVVLFAVMMFLAWRKKPLYRGSYIGVFFILYGVFRIAVEFVREPDVQLGYLAGGWLTMGMVLCLPMIVIGIVMLVYATRTKHVQQGLPSLAPLEETEEPSPAPLEETEEPSPAPLEETKGEPSHKTDDEGLG